MSNYSKKDEQKDFPELEGKEIKLIGSNREPLTGIVAGCNWDIGITIVDKDNPTEEIFCLNGPMSPNKQYYWEDVYNRDFYSNVRQINKGKLNGVISFAIINNYTYPKAVSYGSGGNIACAFKS